MRLGQDACDDEVDVRNRWNDDDAAAYVAKWGDAWGEDLALRVYTSHLIGAETALVLHGGGNTSVKTTVRSVVGDDVEVVCVKGSGWNLGDIQPQGFPAVDLHHMHKVLQVVDLSDEDMVNEQRTHLLDASSPNPSVETLLHAFFPYKFVDHSHADAVLSLTNHPDGEAHVKAALGDDICIVPYVMPGFDLARLASHRFSEEPDCTAMVLMKHGLFTWGATAEEAYSRHMELVTKAEAYVAARQADPPAQADAAAVAAAEAKAGWLAPLLRRALADGRTWIVGHRVDPELLGYVDDPRLDRWVAAGCLTPDHVIRTKPLGCVVRVPDGADDAAAQAAVDAAIGAFRDAYDAYFERNAKGGSFTKLDTTPRLILVPGVGVFGVGETPKAATIVLDITTHTLRTKAACEGAMGGFEGLPEKDLFDVEYWSLEQAKLGKKAEKPLQRKVALVTGAAGAIGLGVAEALRAAGACVALADVDESGLERALEQIGKGADVMAVRMDVTQPASVTAAFEAVAARFGGVDIVVPNAGIAHSAPITDLDEDAFRKVMEVNSHGVFLTVREAGRQMKRQGTGGHVVLVGSKNVAGPGAEFAAYSASKAAAHQLCKVAAMEFAAFDVAVNLVAPDAVFGHGDVPSGLWAEIGPDRARAKGLSAGDLPEHYRQRNLLRSRVTAADVGRAVVFFASGQTPTTGAVLPVDGGVPAAFVR